MILSTTSCLSRGLAVVLGVSVVVVAVSDTAAGGGELLNALIRNSINPYNSPTATKNRIDW